jgi:small subunit ribosomal protein S3Ae
MSEKAKKKSKTKKVSFKDKQWYSLIAPKGFNFKPLGDVVGTDNSIIDRNIEVLLYDITNKYEDINLKLKFRVIDANSESRQCNTIYWGHQYTNDYVRSLVGRGSSKIQTILNLNTKDDYTYRITTICATIKRARSSQQILIRKIMDDILKQFARTLTHEKFITGIIYHEFENQITRVAKTIYPVSSCTIIKSKIISIPEGGEDKKLITQDQDFDIVEVEVKRSRKSEIKRTERINVKKVVQVKVEKEAPHKEKDFEVEEEEIEEEAAK